MTTITYSHTAFTIKQRMFTPRSPLAPGLAVLFEIASVRPLELTISFRPEMRPMWPSPNFGTPRAEWNRTGRYYILHTNNPDFSAAVAIPRAQPGILPPYQGQPQAYRIQFKVSFNPRTDSGSFIPLLIARTAPGLRALNDAIPNLYRASELYFVHFFDSRLTSETPDAQFDRALQWAEIAIDQGRVRFHDETGLIAGYHESGDTARPGFAWFFGRDALWTSYAINSYGDSGLSRAALEFLIRRQRSDGKIMHEYSQTADLVDWASLPYYYAAADSTPLFVMALEDYVNTSGDVGFLRRHWEVVRRAYQFTRAHDSDGDGIYENTEGTGWVESWPPGMPHQEIYLAALDQQSADAMSRLAGFMGDYVLASAAAQKAAEIRARIESEYYEPNLQFYAFSRNADGTLDHSATIFPSVAWWTGRLTLPHAEQMLERWASPEFSTDWGTRDLSPAAPFYDPISYHQGSVRPLYTGWVSLAQFRAGRPLSAYQHLMQNVDLTWSQDLGAVTELLSGEFFQEFDRSSSHQIWSSAMVVTPALRGLFGLNWDALHHTLLLSPHLPAAWDRAQLHNVRLGNVVLDLEFLRVPGQLIIIGRSRSPQQLCLAALSQVKQNCQARPATEYRLEVPLPPVEVEIRQDLPAWGSQTEKWRITGERRMSDSYELEVAGPAGSLWELPLRLNVPGIRVTGAELSGKVLRIRSPSGTGYQQVSVKLNW
jgi:glycogen debranching enzyme